MKFEIEIPDPDFELKPNEVLESRGVNWGMEGDRRIVDRARYDLSFGCWEVERNVPLEWEPTSIDFEIVTKEPKLSWLNKLRFWKG